MPIYCIIFFPSNPGQSKEALEDSADDSLSLHTVPVPVICCRLWAISSLLIVHHLRVPFLIFICRFRPSCVPAWFDDTNNILFRPCCGDKDLFFFPTQTKWTLIWTGMVPQRGGKKNLLLSHMFCINEVSCSSCCLQGSWVSFTSYVLRRAIIINTFLPQVCADACQCVGVLFFG